MDAHRRNVCSRSHLARILSLTGGEKAVMAEDGQSRDERIVYKPIYATQRGPAHHGARSDSQVIEEACNSTELLLADLAETDSTGSTNGPDRTQQYPEGYQTASCSSSEDARAAERVKETCDQSASWQQRPRQRAQLLARQLNTSQGDCASASTDNSSSDRQASGVDGASESQTLVGSEKRRHRQPQRGEHSQAGGIPRRWSAQPRRSREEISSDPPRSRQNAQPTIATLVSSRRRTISQRTCATQAGTTQFDPGGRSHGKVLHC